MDQRADQLVRDFRERDPARKGSMRLTLHVGVGTGGECPFGRVRF